MTIGFELALWTRREFSETKQKPPPTEADGGGGRGSPRCGLSAGRYRAGAGRVSLPR